MGFLDLSPEEQATQRRQAVQAVSQGERQADVARRLGVSRKAIHKWVLNHRWRGPQALVTHPAGRPPGSRLLNPRQIRELVQEIATLPPEETGLYKSRLWSPPTVQQWIAHEFSVTLSLSTIRVMLAQWGIQPCVPSRTAVGRSATFARWLRVDYPAIRRQARREKVPIFWVCDATSTAASVAADKTLGVPLVGVGRRSLLIATSTRGQVRFVFERNRYSAAVLVPFLTRLVKDIKANCHVLLPDRPVNRDPRVLNFEYARLRFWPE